jgi:hypothetical protein
MALARGHAQKIKKGELPNDNPPEKFELSGLFDFVHMDIHLWEGEADALGIESFLNFLHNIEINDPFVICFGPAAHFKIHTAIC